MYRRWIHTEAVVPINQRKKPVVEEVSIIEVQPSAKMLDDIIVFYHAVATDESAQMSDRLGAAKALTEIARYGFQVDPMFATSSYVASSQ